MKFIYLIAILIFSQSVFSNTNYIRLIKLPHKAKEVLKKEFEEWDFFNSPIPHFDSSGVMDAWEYADLIKADFNNDSKEDYAALIKPNKTENGFLVILTAIDSGFNFMKLKEVPYYRDRVLFLASKGSKLFNFKTEKEFILPSDGVTLAVYEKTGSTYYLVGDEFIEVFTSD